MCVSVSATAIIKHPMSQITPYPMSQSTGMHLIELDNVLTCLHISVLTAGEIFQGGWGQGREDHVTAQPPDRTDSGRPHVVSERNGGMLPVEDCRWRQERSSVGKKTLTQVCISGSSSACTCIGGQEDCELLCTSLPPSLQLCDE